MIFSLMNKKHSLWMKNNGNTKIEICPWEGRQHCEKKKMVVTCILHALSTKKEKPSKINVKQDVFVKHECPRNRHFLRNVTFIFDPDLCR